MNQLKKYGAIGGAVALVLCWPLAVGHIGQQVVEDGVEQLNNEGVTAEIVTYDRGYLSSNVETRYQVNDPVLKEQLEVDGLPTEIVVQSEISHGLFSLTANSHIQNYPDFPLALKTVTQLNGNTEFELSLDSWSYQGDDAQKVSMSISPSVATGTATVLGQLTFNANIPSIQLDFENGEQLTLTDLSANGVGKKEQGFWLGDQSVMLKNFTILDEMHTSILNIDDLGYTFKSSFDSEVDRIDTQHIFSMSNMTYPDGGQLSDLKVDFALTSLDRESFEGLVDLYQTNPTIAQADITTLAPLIETLFARGFNVAMNDMHFKVADDEFKSNWLLKVPEGTENVSRDPSVVMPALTGNMNAYMSEGMVNVNPMLAQGIDELVVMEMVTQQDAGYQMKADIEGGQLVFANGQKIPLVALFLPLLMGQSMGQ
ncbi:MULTISPECIES: DUF945 family protein [Vibrio]|uniref:DUF945 family protein n=1 Tax=Vibrio TaxID=662 RepID=UPI00148E721E|nr:MULTISPECIES: DUF945 family protein [Vibrio]MCF4173281.1 DUF945 family protein [Vibrio sp. McD22-P3]NOI24714.1 DUF945 family protein [Vibrio mediterranei]